MNNMLIRSPRFRQPLHGLIYNPELPVGWGKLPDNQKIIMFHKLFLLLNPDFQREHGERLNNLVSLFLAEEKGEYISEHPYFRRDKRGRIRISDKRLNKMKFSALRLFNTLKRRLPIEAMEVNNITVYNPNSIKAAFKDDYHYDRYAVELGLYKAVGDYTDIFNAGRTSTAVLRSAKSAFTEYVNKLQNGIIHEEIFPAISIKFSREKIMKDFEEYIDQMQSAYFEQHPEKIRFDYGDKPLKHDGRSQRYPFDEWAMYFKFYVLTETRQKKQRDLVDEYFRDDADTSGKSKVSTYLKKARKLIENADGNFPGNYN